MSAGAIIFAAIIIALAVLVVIAELRAADECAAQGGVIVRSTCIDERAVIRRAP